MVIYHSDQEAIDTAVSLIERIVKKAEVGEIYDGTIARVNDNYAFVTLFEGTDGFLHISDWSYERTSKMQDVCKVGDVIKVKVTKVDDKGKVNVSRKALLPKPVKKEEKNEKERVNKDYWRLNFHLMPPVGWLNDPNRLHSRFCRNRRSVRRKFNTF